MSKDYELGRLAEELIASRYKEKTEEYEKSISDLRKQLEEKDLELQKEKDDKTYLHVFHHSGYGIGGGYETYEYKTFDELTENVKNTEDKNKELNRKLFNVKNDIKAFKDINIISKMFYKFKEGEDE